MQKIGNDMKSIRTVSSPTRAAVAFEALALLASMAAFIVLLFAFTIALQ